MAVAASAAFLHRLTVCISNREVLPSDSFQQLDVACKINSLAFSTRVYALESESSDLRRQFTKVDAIIADLHSQLDSLDSSLSQNHHKLFLADQKKENALLLETINKQLWVYWIEVMYQTIKMSLTHLQRFLLTGGQ